MKVAVDATPLLGARTGVGALAQGTFDSLTARPELGVELCAYALSWRGRSALASALPRGVVPARGPMAARPLRAAWLRMDHPVIERWTGPVAVVHGTNFVVPPTRRAAPVVTVHDLTPVRFPEMCTADTLAYPGLLRRALRRGAWVHTPSAFVAAEVVSHFGIDPERVVAVAPGVPGVPGAAEATAVAATGRRLYLLALGTIEPRKDHVTLVAAFDALARRWPDLQLVLAGAPGWAMAEVAAAVAGARHRDRIVSLGWVPEPQRARLLAEATVFVFPSRYEGFGFPPLEAMRAGVPVVATSAGSLPEVLGDAARLVSPGNVEALEEAIEGVLADQGEQARLAAAGRARAACFSWDSYATGMADLYRRARAGF